MQLNVRLLNFDKRNKQKDNCCFAVDNRFCGLKGEKGEDRDMLRE